MQPRWASALRIHKREADVRARMSSCPAGGALAAEFRHEARVVPPQRTWLEARRGANRGLSPKRHAEREILAQKPSCPAKVGFCARISLLERTSRDNSEFVPVRRARRLAVP